MNELHLFAGAGGGILGDVLLGHTCVCAVEIEPYCRKVLLQRQRDGILPKFPIWDDVRTFDGKPWRGKVDVVCGGFPCQDISVSGTRLGLDGKRSGLWSEMSRIIRQIRPQFVFVENSPALVIRGLDRVLRDLAAMGYNAKWGVFSASDAGAPHIRERIWILAYSDENNRTLRVQSKNDGIERSWTKTNQRSPNRIRFEVGQALLALRHKWPDKPESCRVANGLADWRDRLAAIGNGQVPTVVKLAWKILKP